MAGKRKSTSGGKVRRAKGVTRARLATRVRTTKSGTRRRKK